MFHPCFDFRYLFIISLVIFVAACGGDSSSSDSSGDDFPTPTLPAGARTITETNANETATSAATFVVILNEFGAKTGEPQTVEQVVDGVIDRLVRRGRPAQSRFAARVEDLSADFCVSGSAIADFEETDTSESGSITFTECNIGSGIIVNGVTSYASNYNASTLDYNVRTGGTLEFDFGSPPVVTIVFNQFEEGNEGSGNFSANISFSLAGIPGGGFLVTTAQNVVGNFSGVTGGQLIVAGSANTRLRLTVIGADTLSLDLDNGNGIFVSCAAIPASPCTSPLTI